MNIANIKYCDIANGPGVRTSLFVSGCTRRCPGCFNEVAWDFGYGEPFTQELEERVLESIAPSYIRGLTILGGEPMEPVNQRVLLPFLRRFRDRLPDKDLWCYTGYTLEEDLLAERGAARCEVTDEILSLLDVLVDGEFLLAKKSLMLTFRGSSNQRLIDMKRTLADGTAVLFEPGE